MGALKVLHIHDSDLDDPRIITAAMTGKKHGYEEYFCGVFTGTTLVTDVFTEMKWVQMDSRSWIAKHTGLPPLLEKFWYWYPWPRNATMVERQIKKAVESIRPDIIHGHNIIASHYALNLGIPMILDDHEYLSMHIKAQRLEAPDQVKGFKNRKRWEITSHRWKQWEGELAEKCPIITVSEPITEYYRTMTNRAETVPNYPMRDEIVIDKFRPSSHCKDLVSVYIGTDDPNKPTPIRNIKGLYDIFKTNRTGKLLRIGVRFPNMPDVRCIGNVDMQLAYDVMMQKAHIGLLPWRKNWFHKYCCPNKAYEYAHCGLWLITTNDLDPVIKDFGSLCDTIERMEDLPDLLSYYNEHRSDLDQKRLDTYKYAQENFVWEKHEHKILEAYKVA